MIEVIPAICRKYENVVFVVGGSGPMQIDLEEMIERHNLQDRVEMLGAVEHHKVRDVLASGHIFLNCSLTEAFCIAIVEAVSCGLLCVSTRVGGVPEVLPDDMIKLAEPNGDDLIEKVEQAIIDLPSFDSWRAHESVKSMYSWFDVAQRTEIVYDRLLREEKVPFMERLRRFYACGLWAGKIFCIIVALAYLFWQILEWWSPEESVELAPNLNYAHWQQYLKNSSKAGASSSSSSAHRRTASGGHGWYTGSSFHGASSPTSGAISSGYGAHGTSAARGASLHSSAGFSHERTGSTSLSPIGLSAASPSPSPGGSSSHTPGHSRKPSRTLGRSIAGSMEVLWEELPDDHSRPTTPSLTPHGSLIGLNGSSGGMPSNMSSDDINPSPRIGSHSSSRHGTPTTPTVLSPSPSDNSNSVASADTTIATQSSVIPQTTVTTASPSSSSDALRKQSSAQDAS